MFYPGCLMSAITLPTPRQKSSARLHAVQAVYQMMITGYDARTVLQGFFESAGPVEPEMEGIEVPAADLMSKIVQGVERQRGELEPVIINHLKNEAAKEGMAEREPLLLAILLCGTYELMAHTDIDAPLIIADYLNVTHSYYQGEESRMVNGILDALRQIYRTKD